MTTHRHAARPRLHPRRQFLIGASCMGASILTGAGGAAPTRAQQPAAAIPRIRVLSQNFEVARHPHSEMERPDLRPDISIQAHVQWPNSWRNARNHDAAWLFCKVYGLDSSGELSVRHAKIMRAAVADTSPDARVARPEITLSADRTGCFLEPSVRFRGAIAATVKLHLDAAIIDGLAPATLRATLFAIEMVHIPASPFYLGAGSADELEYGAFYRSTASGSYGGPYLVDSEAKEIAVGPREGALNYKTLQKLSYMGDGLGPIPSAFPKGVAAFYMMKYEVSQGEYAAFLNHIAGYAADTRANFAGPTYYQDRGTIRLEGGRYVALSPDRPANFIGWEDGIAFLDWAALRPMSEFEFEKAARGPERPGAYEFVWGTPSTSRLKRAVLESGDVGMLESLPLSALSDDTRDVFGASHYWVMDLSGSLWERTVTAGDPPGRAYTAAHGDGAINAYGDADVEHWPRELGSPRRHKGFGYRGGGFYRPGEAHDKTRPHGPVSFRSYASWSGGPRYHAYGIRGVRTQSAL